MYDRFFIYNVWHLFVIICNSLLICHWLAWNLYYASLNILVMKQTQYQFWGSLQLLIVFCIFPQQIYISKKLQRYQRWVDGVNNHGACILWVSLVAPSCPPFLCSTLSNDCLAEEMVHRCEQRLLGSRRGLMYGIAWREDSATAHWALTQCSIHSSTYTTSPYSLIPVSSREEKGG